MWSPISKKILHVKEQQVNYLYMIVMVKVYDRFDNAKVWRLRAKDFFDISYLSLTFWRTQFKWKKVWNLRVPLKIQAFVLTVALVRILTEVIYLRRGSMLMKLLFTTHEEGTRHHMSLFYDYRSLETTCLRRRTMTMKCYIHHMEDKATYHFSPLL